MSEIKHERLSFKVFITKIHTFALEVKEIEFYKKYFFQYKKYFQLSISIKNNKII